jgi:carboxyl-terminal processing protease
MKLSRFLRLSIASLCIFSLGGGLVADEPDPGQIEISVGRLLEQGHYSRRKLDDSVSKLLLKNYLEALDYNHLFFTQKDVDGFNARYATTLDDDILLGNPDAAYKIFDLYKKRVEDRVAKVKEVVTESFDFTSDRTEEINRQKVPWPKDDAAADKLWHDRIEGELLLERLAKKAKIATAKAPDGAKAPDAKDPEPPAAPAIPQGGNGDTPAPEKLFKPKAEGTTPEEKITKRYDQVLRDLHEQTREDVIKIFLTTLAQTYDPHSDYMSRQELESFEITMRLSLIGIGAVLHSEEGYAKIMELVVGGPAAKEGHLKVGDRVTGVAQGDKEFVDTVDMKLDKVVEMIRGKKDTTVRLQVIPVSATDPAARKIVEIKRAEIKLKDQEAHAEIIERPQADGTVQRLGWIVLPSFYADMENSGKANATSTTKDVLALLNRLKAEGITGLVMDLRRDGGGSLEEAVNLTGLFVKKGPVVQSKDSNGNIHVSKHHNPVVTYDGPMIVLCNRLSASASEIFAAALQDYNRAVIVGDQNTFGKGTVQTMLEIGRVMPFLGGGHEAGALKLTIQKFYRIAGGSTQLHGVTSDVKLPSLFDQAEIGESSLKGPLPYDTVDPVPFDKVDKPLFKPELAKRSAARVESDPEFGYITDDLERLKKRIAENKVSLNLKVRQAEIDEDKARRTQRTAERAEHKATEPKVFKITLDNVTKPDLELANVDKHEATTAEAAPDSDEADAEDAAAAKKPPVDPVRNETLNILSDLVELSHVPRTAAK